MDILNIIIILAIAVLLGYVLVKVLKTVKNIIINIALGFIVIIVASFFLPWLPSVSELIRDWITIILCAFGGVFGAILSIILYYFGVLPL
ncbi:MAG: transcriptional regulator [Methanosarcinaceae archaeon]|nr:transcriptional regulator [Methanosarcinaceae archaeon]